VLLILTSGGADVQSDCAGEWRRALRYKKPVFPLRVVPGVDAPLILGRRPVLDFTGVLAPAVADLRRRLDDLTSPAGQLRELEYRLADAERELRAAPKDPRILSDIAQLEKDILTQRAVVSDPAGRRPRGPPVGNASRWHRTTSDYAEVADKCVRA